LAGGAVRRNEVRNQELRRTKPPPPCWAVPPLPHPSVTSLHTGGGTDIERTLSWVGLELKMTIFNFWENATFGQFFTKASNCFFRTKILSEIRKNLHV
jgi:hypothetical protein